MWHVAKCELWGMGIVGEWNCTEWGLWGNGVVWMGVVGNEECEVA